MRTCVICACTDELACPEGCHWVEILSPRVGRCSMCPPLSKAKLSKAQRADRRRLRLIVRNTDRRRRTLMRDYIRAMGDYMDAVNERREFERAPK